MIVGVTGRVGVGKSDSERQLENINTLVEDITRFVQEFDITDESIRIGLDWVALGWVGLVWVLGWIGLHWVGWVDLWFDWVAYRV